MKKRNRIIIITVAVIITLSNTPPIQYFFRESYHYQNRDGSFEFTEQGGPTQGFDVTKRRFEAFKTDNPSNPNKTLYRTFIIKPWRFWEWWQMIFNHERFTLPYYPKDS